MTENQSWDDFWAEVSPKGRTETIRGVVVRVPTDIPLAFEARYQDLQHSAAEEDVADLLELLFGADVLGAWQDAGMGMRELQTVLTWAVSHGYGKPISFRDALELVDRAEAEGKPPAPTGANRAQRRQYERTGGRSRRTSSGSTGSARTRSRR